MAVRVLPSMPQAQNLVVSWASASGDRCTVSRSLIQPGPEGLARPSGHRPLPQRPRRRRIPASASGAFRGAPRSAARTRPPTRQGLPAALHPLGRPLESQAGVFHASHQSGDEDRLFAREEPGGVRLRDADALGDRLGGCAVQPLSANSTIAARTTLSRLSCALILAMPSFKRRSAPSWARRRSRRAARSASACRRRHGRDRVGV